jgi:hypothetical protein
MRGVKFRNVDLVWWQGLQSKPGANVLPGGRFRTDADVPMPMY